MKITRLKKEDTVFVKSGKDKGKTGKILKIFPQKLRAIVEGINFTTKHVRRTRQDQQGGIVKRESTINISNLMYYCPRCTRPTRLGMSKMADGTFSRFCKKCNETI